MDFLATFEPCTNGIDTEGVEVIVKIKEASLTMKVEQLWFDVKTKTVMSKLVDQEKPFYKILFPAVRLELVESNYMKSDVLDIPADFSQLNRAFYYLAALKRLNRVSQNKRNNVKDVSLLDHVSKGLFGTGSNGETKFHIDPKSEKFLKHSEWDALLGVQ